MGYLRPSQLFRNTFHLAICNPVASGSQHIVFITIERPSVTSYIQCQIVLELTAIMEDLNQSPKSFSFS